LPVLIDSTSPTTPAPGAEAPSAASDGPFVRGSALVSVVTRLGLGRIYSLTSYGSLPAQSRDEVRATISTAATFRSTLDEFAQASTSMQEAAELRDFGAKPLVVLTAADGSDASWFAKQDKLARLSTNTVHRVVAGASHEMLVEDQTASASTIAAIRDMVSGIRTGSPLAR
jgi:hypothetical protein